VDPLNSHFLFGGDSSWEKITTEIPLAICIGCPSEELDRHVDTVNAALPNFHVEKSEKFSKYSAFIVRNRLFEEMFPASR
jgi:hypothetical protein